MFGLSPCFPLLKNNTAVRGSESAADVFTEPSLPSPSREGILLGQRIKRPVILADTEILADTADFPPVGVVPFSCLPQQDRRTHFPIILYLKVAERVDLKSSSPHEEKSISNFVW